MKPYFEEEGITIYHGDCREVLPSLEAGAILTDPPYGNKTEYESFDDSRQELRATISRQLLAAMQKSAGRVALTCGVANMWLYPEPTWVLCWHTPAGVGSGPWGFCCWQPVLVYGKDPYLQNGLGRRHDSIVWTESAEENGHPCPKPIGIWKWLIKRISSNPDESILDPFMGSGTTLRAAKDLGRRAIGIEIEEKYCEIAAKRLSQKVFDFR